MIIFSMVLIGICIVAYSIYPQPKQEKELNICLHLSDYNYETIPYLVDLNIEWVRTDWLITPDKSMQNYCQDLQNNNIKILTIIDVNTFGNQNFTLEQWNMTVTEIVTSEGFDTVDAVEIWNEPNAIAYIDPEIYCELLKSAYVIIKNYTSIPVVLAGISPNIDGWQTYLNEIFANSYIEEYFDYMGIHLYDDVATNFETLQFVRNLTSKPIWLTETGKPSENNAQVAQANYIESIYSNFRFQVNKIFIYELYDGEGAYPEAENYFGLLSLNGVKKEAYNVVWEINRK
ncbi:MAG: glycosyl hydrolase [Candidatus Bathyarchaeota archaeon]|nr:glycosyl hydrolase [Candidatus Bathyarchaeota archaeon]